MKGIPENFVYNELDIHVFCQKDNDGKNESTIWKNDLV